MSAIIIQFPRPYRHRSPKCRPFNAVHVIRGEGNETWTIAGSAGWLHGSLNEALTDAIGLASDYGVPVLVEAPHA